MPRFWWVEKFVNLLFELHYREPGAIQYGPKQLILANLNQNQFHAIPCNWINEWQLA